MHNKEDRQSLPRKVLPRDFRKKQNPKTEKKRSVSINLVKSPPHPLRSKSSNKGEDAVVLNNHIFAEPQPTKQFNQISLTEVPKDIIVLPTPSKAGNRREITLPQLSPFGNSFDLQDYERQFLLKMRAQAFIRKIKKEREETNRKLMEMKEKEQELRDKKQEQLNIQRMAQEEAQRSRKLKKVEYMARQLEFNRERREEERNIRDKLRLKKHQQASNSPVNQEDRIELDRFINKRSRKVVNKEIEYNKLTLSPPNKVPGSPLKLDNDRSRIKRIALPEALLSRKKQDNKVPDDAKRVKNRGRSLTNVQLSRNLQRHLYLSAEDEHLLDRIKKNMDKLQLLTTCQIPIQLTTGKKYNTQL